MSKYTWTSKWMVNKIGLVKVKFSTNSWCLWNITLITIFKITSSNAFTHQDRSWTSTIIEENQYQSSLFKRKYRSGIFMLGVLTTCILPWRYGIAYKIMDSCYIALANYRWGNSVIIIHSIPITMQYFQIHIYGYIGDSRMSSSTLPLMVNRFNGMLIFWYYLISLFWSLAGWGDMVRRKLCWAWMFCR